MIEAVIFDFDGLILETEAPVYQAWREVYESFNCHLKFEDWSSVIGADPNHFDPFISLEAQLGRRVDREEVGRRRMQRERELVNEQPIMPGVLDYLSEARQLGLKIGLASSSDYAWVGGHLTRLGLLDRFDAIHTSDNVEKAKPAPDLFLSALQGLNTAAERAIAFEDSYNGIRSAHGAGIFCVVVPNEMTRSLPLDLADLRIDSLADLPLKQLIEEIEIIKAKI